MKNIANIIKISRPLYHLIFPLAVLILLTAAIELVAPVLSKFIVDEIVSKIQGHGASTQRLILLIAVAFGANLMGVLLTSVSERLGDHFAGRLRKYLTEKFYYKILALPQSYFDSEISGKIVHQLNRAITSIQNFVNAATNFMLPMLLQSIFTIAVLAYYNIPIAIFTFLLFPIYLTLSYWSAKKWGLEEIKKNKIEDITRGRIQEVVSNIKLVTSFNSQKAEYKFLEKSLGDINKIYAKQSRTFHIFDFARNFSLHIILLAINLVVFYSAFSGSMSIGTMVLILQLVTQARRPLFAMSFMLTQIQTAESGSKEYFEILNLPSSEDFDSRDAVSIIRDASIEFKNVSFAYDEAGDVLKNVSFVIGKDEAVALVGPSGTGKTTIANLILKFYEPGSGEIYLKGKPYKKFSHNFIRSNVSLVFQESELFSTSVRENVAYGDRRHTEKQIITALKKANAWEFVRKLPQGLGTLVGERGVRLSGGQKQRIQIARAILKNSPILILDEATSSLDAKSEREVQVALENLMAGKLVIIIAHRFSTIQNVDKVIVVDEGKVVDSGNPQELAKKPGVYSDLLNYQIEGNRKLLEKFELH
ncbi:MAG: ABC transporter ATP-binding protein/permease [Candidatus Curtissbacteria bacterium]|nr:ABC transporter ATP-binding protein/permease [Candidatus Curtissbacteria bacterium]